MTFRWLPEYKYEYEYEYATRPSEYRLSLSVFQRMSIPMRRIKGWGQVVALSKSAAPNSMKVSPGGLFSIKGCALEKFFLFSIFICGNFEIVIIAGG